MTQVNEELSGKLENESQSDNAALQKIKVDIHRQLLEVLDLNEAQRIPLEQLHEECSRRVDALLTARQYPLSGPEKQRLLREVMDEVFGFGPLEVFLRDPLVSDILVNGPSQIYIEKRGQLESTDVTFMDEKHLMRIIHRIGANVGRRIDESMPMLDARLPDGSRVNAIIPPLALDGPMVSIRRFGTTPIDIHRLLELDSLTEDMAYFMEACVQCRMNILISGGTGTGKTTFLNALSRWIPAGERVVTIEDAAELQIQRRHVVRLETRPPNIEGEGTITQRDLVRNSLRMRPDRIIVGEVRGAETLDMLQAMNTGHEGSMTTVHANSPRDALRRLENMVLMSGINYPMRAIREQLSSAMDVLIHLKRMTGGKRKVVSIVEITAMEGDTICLHDLFQFKQTGVDDQGHANGHFEACGVRPLLLERLHAKGVQVPNELFKRRILTGAGSNDGDR
ncbi:MAG: pilus assembly protein CpaF [Planctomycetes bacterium B3_Pla]|nr:MAG: pilus assembly protein CpaF [Planctomycetes bacterium B3_Pla]